MKSATLSSQNLVADLIRSSEDGVGFEVDEIVDTVVTMFIAGRLAADALQALVVQLQNHRDWATRVSEEAQSLKSIEEESVTLKVVKETLRLKPPLPFIRREALNSSRSISLGPHGEVPPGTSVAGDLGSKLIDMASDFNPDRWVRELSHEASLPWGGPQPHACIGKYLALTELQLFARILCQEYTFKVLNDELCVDPKNPFGLSYKDGLRMHVTKKTDCADDKYDESRESRKEN